MTKGKSPKSGKSATNAGNPSTLKPWMAHILAVLAFLAVTAAYFYPQLEGKVIMQGDILGWRGMAQESMKYYEETGELALWSNSMFGGMPTFQTNNTQPGNYLQHILKAGGLFISRPIGKFLAMCVFCYFMLILMKSGPILSWLGGFAFAFTTYHPILFEAGHNLKLLSISTFPVIIAGLYLVFQKKYIPGAIVFAVAMGMAMYANHVQMTYYLGLVMLIWYLVEAVRSAREGAWKHLGISSALLGIALILGVASSAGKLWTTYEYSKDTMRGEPILESSDDPQSSSETDGLAWDYAMQWSQGSLELFTILVPGVVGGSSNERLPRNSEFRASLSSRGVNLPPDFKAPLYWGSLPFTSGPAYFGVFICLAFLMGMLLEKGPMKWWILAGVLFSLLFSMGKNFESLNRLLYDHLPLLNKFRAPNSVTAITPILMIILGMSVIRHIFIGTHTREQVQRALLIAGGSLGAICLFFAFMGTGFFDFTSEGDTRLQQSGYPMDALIADRQALMQGDAYRSLFFLAASCGLIWFFLRNKIKATYALAGLAALTVIDLWGVNKRYLGTDDFVPKSEYDNYFRPRPVDEEILRDKDLSYRVHDLSINTFNSSFASYFHKTIGGYHAAKLQRYQDIIDRYISRGDMNVLNMLNTRYFILQQDEEEPYVQQNPGALGNAWPVSRVQMVNSAIEEINALGEEFDPSQTAIVHKDFADYIKRDSFSAEGNIQLTDYTPNRLTYSFNANEEQLIVFSEIWYGPDKGWKTTIDGEPADHFRVNYLLRGMVIPAGNHTIVFSFEPRSHFIGEKIARASSGILLILALLLLASFWIPGLQQKLGIARE
jgi:hypothetical protein